MLVIDPDILRLRAAREYVGLVRLNLKVKPELGNPSSVTLLRSMVRSQEARFHKPVSTVDTPPLLDAITGIVSRDAF